MIFVKKTTQKLSAVRVAILGPLVPQSETC